MEQDAWRYYSPRGQQKKSPKSEKKKLKKERRETTKSLLWKKGVERKTSFGVLGLDLIFMRGFPFILVSSLGGSGNRLGLFVGFFIGLDDF